MPISWYPGHMHKARKELIAAMEDSDLFLEVLDARLPQSSSNPLMAEFGHQRPSIRILNKADLAEPKLTNAWQDHFNSRSDSICLLNCPDHPIPQSDIIFAANRLLARSERPRKILIVGVPNCGKSTLLNQLAGRKLAKTGNEPALTRHQQRIKLDNDWVLVDTPGLLWPRLENQHSAFLLAISGAIRNTAIDLNEVGWYAAELLLRDHFPALSARYGLKAVPAGTEDFLQLLGKHRGCLGRNGSVDTGRAAELLLNDLRSGKIGRLSLEQPDSLILPNT